MSDDEDNNSINSWDEQLGECSDDEEEEDDIDVLDDVDPLSPTTSDSSRGGSSPTRNAVGVGLTAATAGILGVGSRSRSRK